MACGKCINMRDKVCNGIAGVLPLRVVYWCLVRMAVYIEQPRNGQRPVGSDNISLQRVMRVARAKLNGAGPPW